MRVTKVSLRLIHRLKPREIQITVIYNVFHPWLHPHDVEHIDVAQIAVGNVNEAWECFRASPAAYTSSPPTGGAKQRLLQE